MRSRRAPNAPVFAGVVLGLLVGWATAGTGEKSTELRAWDVVALGPWLAVLAVRNRPLVPWQRVALAFTAGATIAHNARNMFAKRLPCLPGQ